MDQSTTFTADMGQSCNVEHLISKSRSSSRNLEDQFLKKINDVQDLYQLGEETQSSTNSPNIDSSIQDGAFSYQYDNFHLIKNNSIEKELKKAQQSWLQTQDQGAYSYGDVENNMKINAEIQKMDSAQQINNFNLPSHHEMLGSKLVSQRAQRKQSETSHFQSRLQEIHQNSIIDYSNDSCAKILPGIVPSEGPHLKNVEKKVVLTNERQDQKSVIFGNSIFSMPVDFTENNEVNKEVNNPLEDINQIAVQTHSSQNQQQDEILDDFDHRSALGMEVSRLTESPVPKRQSTHQIVSNKDSIQHDYKPTNLNFGIKVIQVESIDQKVVKMADQLSIPSIEEQIHDNNAAMQSSLGATPVPRQSGGLPTLENMAIHSLMPPTRTNQRKRFNSSMHDMMNNCQNRLADQYTLDGQTDNLSTSISYISDYENQITAKRMSDQKRREQEVLDRIQKIWSDMASMKKEIQQAQHDESSPLRLEAHMSSTQQNLNNGKVSISAQLGLEVKSGCGPLFRIHQETQINSAVSNIEKQLMTKIDSRVYDHPSDNRAKAIGDMILAEMGLSMMPQAAQQQPLELIPQYSSDFISYNNLQKEIDEQCLSVGPSRVNQVGRLLQNIPSLSLTQEQDASN